MLPTHLYDDRSIFRQSACLGCALDEARVAKPEALRVFGKLTELAGVGITRSGQGYGLKVNVRHAPAPGVVLPERIAGVPVKVEVTGRVGKQTVRL